MEFLIICYLFLCVFLLGCAGTYAMLVFSKAHTFRSMGYDWIESIEKAKGFYS